MKVDIFLVLEVTFTLVWYYVFLWVYKYCKYIDYTEILFFILILNLSSVYRWYTNKTTRQSLNLDAFIVDFLSFTVHVLRLH